MAVSQRFHVGRLLSAAAHVVTSDAYESMALSRAQDQITSARRAIVTGVLTGSRKDKAPLESWLASDPARLTRLSGELAVLGDSGEATLAKVMVAAGLLGDLASAGAK